MKLLEFKYDGYDCYLPKDIKFGEDNWVGIEKTRKVYKVYNMNDEDVCISKTLDEAIKKASEYYYERKDGKERVHELVQKLSLKKPKKEFQCPECGSKTGDEKVYTIKGLWKLEEQFGKENDHNMITTCFLDWLEQKDKQNETKN